MDVARLSLRAGGRFHVRRFSGRVRDGDRVRWRSGGRHADADAGGRGARAEVAASGAGKACRALVFRSRCRFRSTTVRHLPRARRVSRWRVSVMPTGRLAVAAPDRVLASTARRAAVNEISRGWTGCPARRPLRAGAAWRAAARASARHSSVPHIQAACSAAISAGLAERKIGPWTARRR